MDDARVFIVRVTSRCNMACSYCYVRGEADVTISLDTVERLIAQTAGLAEHTLVFVWHGGEPLLMGLRFFEAVVECQKQFPKNFINAVQTNGLALHDAYLDFFEQHDFRIAVSLDIPREQHDQNRRLRNGAGGSFDLIAGRLERLAQRGLPVAVLGVVTDLDTAVEDYLRVIERCRLDSLALNIEFDLARKPGEASAAALSRLLTALYDYAAAGDRPFVLREADAVIEHLRRLPVAYCWHSAEFCGETHLAVAENGDIYVCCDKFIGSPWAGAKLGNIRTDRLAAILASDRFRQGMRDLSALRSACSIDCTIGRFCKGACAHDALVTQMAGAEPGDRRGQVGCVARAALFHHITHDFHTSAQA